MNFTGISRKNLNFTRFSRRTLNFIRVSTRNLRYWNGNLVSYKKPEKEEEEDLE